MKVTRVQEKSSRAPERALRSQPTPIAKQIFALCAVARRRPRIFPECYILLQRVIKRSDLTPQSYKRLKLTGFLGEFMQGQMGL